jgi:hypothetical protein
MERLLFRDLKNMAQDETLQDIIDRIQGARDRLQNAGDDKGVLDAEQALSDLRGLDAKALPTAQDVEEYFNERAAIRVKKAPREGDADRKKSTDAGDGGIDDSSDNS